VVSKWSLLTDWDPKLVKIRFFVFCGNRRRKVCQEKTCTIKNGLGDYSLIGLELWKKWLISENLSLY